MTITYQREVLDDKLILEMTPLLLDHMNEICLYDDFKLNPRWDVYLQLESMDMLKVYTARKDNKLIGYALYNIMFSMHYSDVFHAIQDVLFLHPDHRNGMSGVKLIKYADEQLAEIGADLISHHVKVANDFSPILERLGYSQSEKIYEKRLK